jgi:small subunit ribosomal protein S20
MIRAEGLYRAGSHCYRDLFAEGVRAGLPDPSDPIRFSPIRFPIRPRNTGFHMANIKSQIKRNRQNLVRNERNKAVRSELKTRIKRTLAAAEAGDENAAELYREAQKKIDMAVSKGVLDKKTAARRKSRMARKITAS